MKTVKKILKPITLGIFFSALLLSVRPSLEIPFVHFENSLYAQASLPGPPETCYGNCKVNPEADCFINTVDPNGHPIIGICIGMSRNFGFG